MGSKYKAEVNYNPGPGQYDNDASKLKPKTGGSVTIGSAKRKELWDEASKEQLPGPGNYIDDRNTFGKAATVAGMGSKYKPERNDNPGPGQYAVDDSPTKQNSKQ